MSPVRTDDTQITQAKYDVSENYEGFYRFAPVEEAQVSRAMIGR